MTATANESDHPSAPVPTCPAERGLEKCPCPNEGCKNHGDCVPCVENHKRAGSLPFCER